MNRKVVISDILALAMSAGMTVTVSAYNPMAAMEDASRNAVAAAISEGKIPADATIFDCAYSKDANGETVVVQYRDKSGAWVDVTTGKAVPTQDTAPQKRLPNPVNRCRRRGFRTGRGIRGADFLAPLNITTIEYLP